MTDLAADIDWSLLQAFRLVATAPSLRSATTGGGPSAATLSRRVKALETAMGCALLQRDATGQRLTEAGAATLQVAERMHRASLALAGIGAPERLTVRIAAGYWMTQFLAGSLAGPRDADGRRITLDWHVGTARLDIAHREAHIGIRNTRPHEPSLAARRLSTVGFAVYRRLGSQRRIDDGEWVCGGSGTPSVRWVEARPGQVVARVSDPLLLRALLHADTGLAVLPCFAGDVDPLLERLGQPIASLEHEQWLVAHPDDRALPAVRITIEAIVALTAQAAVRLRGNDSTDQRSAATRTGDR